MSSILFALSNILVPLVIMIYRTSIRVRKQGQNSCGQWLCLILYTFVSNFLYYIAYNSKLYLFGDLAIKLAICFLPPNINAKIQKQISYLHLEILFEIIRGHIIEFFYTFHSFLISLAISKMDEPQKKQFKEAIIKELNKENQIEGNQDKSSMKFKTAYKHYDSTGVTCDIITPSMIDKQQKQKDTLRRILSGQKRGPKPSGHLSPPKQQKSLVELTEGDSGMRKKNSILIQRSTTDLGIVQQNDSPHTQVKSMIKNKKVEEKRKAEVKVAKKKQTKKGSISQAKEPSIGFEEQQPSQILNKLDVSDYSDMFQEEDEEFSSEGKSLVTKVEAIIEIGTGASTRLEIYNIELYSNDQIRIMSLYGRQFQRHKLLGIIPGKHGYYELKLQGGKINKRKVKFRGKIDPFAKYLQSGHN